MKNNALVRIILILCLLTLSVPCAFSEKARLHPKNSITFEYIFGVAVLALKGGGIGFGYERMHRQWLASRYQLSFGTSKSNKSGGSISMISASAGVLFYPLEKVSRGLVFRIEGGLIYLSTVGEGLYGGLESHYVLPAITFGCGWKILIGKQRVLVTIQPELSYTLIFPGYTAAGLTGKTEPGSTGLWLGFLHPGFIAGVSF